MKNEVADKLVTRGVITTFPCATELFKVAGTSAIVGGGGTCSTRANLYCVPVPPVNIFNYDFQPLAALEHRSYLGHIP